MEKKGKETKIIRKTDPNVQTDPRRHVFGGGMEEMEFRNLDFYDWEELE